MLPLQKGRSHLKILSKKTNGYNSHRSKEGGNAVIVQDGYEFVEALMVGPGKSNGEWIMDSRCSFHMTPNKP